MSALNASSKKTRSVTKKSLSEAPSADIRPSTMPVGLLAAYLAGVGGNLATWLVYGDNHRGLGASGMVMGALGLLAAQSVGLLKRRNTNAFRFFAGGIFAGGLCLFFWV